MCHINDFERPYITIEKQFTITSTNDERMHITPEKEIISDTILSNDIYLTQQNYQREDSYGKMPSERSDTQHNYQGNDSNGNKPSDPSNHESDDENFDDEIQVGSF